MIWTGPVDRSNFIWSARYQLRPSFPSEMTFLNPFGTGTVGRVASASATDLVDSSGFEAGALVSTMLMSSCPLR